MKILERLNSLRRAPVEAAKQKAEGLERQEAEAREKLAALRLEAEGLEKNLFDMEAQKALGEMIEVAPVTKLKRRLAEIRDSLIPETEHKLAVLAKAHDLQGERVKTVVNETKARVLAEGKGELLEILKKAGPLMGELAVLFEQSEDIRRSLAGQQIGRKLPFLPSFRFVLAGVPGKLDETPFVVDLAGADAFSKHVDRAVDALSDDSEKGKT